MSKSSKAFIAFIFCMFISANCMAGSGYKLVWSDEFDGSQIDPKKWGHMVGDGQAYDIPSGWGNNEKQYYTARAKNSYVKNGNLVLAGLKEEFKGHEYTSARLWSRGKGDFLYGKIEARVKLPSSQGQWCAFWLMPTDSAYGTWPLSGEVDILEATNAAPDRVMGSIFFGSAWPEVEHVSRFSEQGTEKKHDLSKDYHIYSVEWQPYEIRWFFDGRLYSAQNKWFSSAAVYPAPFDKRFYMIFNIAVGGSGPGEPDETTAWPMKMYVDWVKVYQSDNKPPSVEIVKPQDKSHVPTGEPVVIEVQATDVDGSIDRVEFYNADELITKITTPPYTLNWDAPDDCYKIRVKAYDNEDFVNVAYVGLTKGVGCPQLPYHGKAAKIPGRIEAEDFDLGKAEEVYHDTDKGNNGGQYRKTTDVDIVIGENQSGYSVGWMSAGEWIKYTVNVEKSGIYDIRFRVASESGGAGIHVKFDDDKKTDVLAVPKTDDWNKYVDIFAKGIKLTAGKHIMKLVVDLPGLNLDYIEIIPAGD